MIRGAVWRVDWADRRPPFGLIVSNNLLNSDSTWPGVLMVPLLLKEPRDSPAKVHIPAGQAGMTQARWALCSAVGFVANTAPTASATGMRFRRHSHSNSRCYGLGAALTAGDGAASRAPSVPSEFGRRTGGSLPRRAGRQRRRGRSPADTQRGRRRGCAADKGGPYPPCPRRTTLLGGVERRLTESLLSTAPLAKSLHPASLTEPARGVALDPLLVLRPTLQVAEGCDARSLGVTRAPSSPR